MEINSLYVENKKISFITGESGSGKTTLLKMLNRMVTPDSGRILFKQKDIGDIDPVSLRRSAAMLPQTPVLFEGSIGDNLSAGALFSEKPLPARQSMLEALKTVKLNKDPDETPLNLSGGERQRLSLARLILMDPEVFLIDEPSSSLDKNTENIVMGNFISHIRQRKKTAVIVSHSPSVAEKYADAIHVIDKGRLARTKDIK